MKALTFALLAFAQFVAAVALLACSSTPPEPGQIGTMRIALVAHTATATYRLRNASFEVTTPVDGAPPIATQSSESNIDAAELTQSLDPGSYRVQLLGMWYLERLDMSGPVRVNATLESPMMGTAAFTIQSGTTTSVPYTFVTDGTVVTFGTGTLSIPIVVKEIDASATPEAAPPTQLNLSASPTMISTELGTTSTVALTLTASNGFGGVVNLAGSVVDAANQAMQGWTIGIMPPTLTLPVNGTATAMVSIAVPSQNRGLSATAKLVASSAAQSGTNTASVAINVLNQFTLSVTTDAGQCVYPAAGTTSLSVGTRVRFLNNGMMPINIHSNGGGAGCPHQATGSETPPGSAYECVLNSLSPPFAWYCHSPGPTVNDQLIRVDP